MANKQNEPSSAAGERAGGDGPGIGKTRLLLQSVLGGGDSEALRLHEEVLRTCPGRGHDPSELIELSVKISRGSFSQNRYGAALTWDPSHRTQIAESIYNAAPSPRLRGALRRPEVAAAVVDEGRGAAAPEETPVERELREFAQRQGRFFSALAYDLDARRYKLYLFKHRPSHFLEDVDLLGRGAELPSLSYIRSLEVGIDDLAILVQPLYFKLRFERPPLPPEQTRSTSDSLPARRRPEEILQPDFSPHPLLSPRLLSVEPAQREVITASLRAILGQRALPNDPVVKFVPPPTVDVSGAPRTVTADDFRALPYGVSLNLLDPQHIAHVEDHADSILAVAEAFGCRGAAAAWLARVKPFECFLSYLGVGPESVTLYYRSTGLRRGRPAPHFRRQGQGAAHGAGAAPQPSPA